MKFTKTESKTYNLSNLPGKEPELPQMPVKKTWEPNGIQHTMPYGGQNPKMVDVSKIREKNDV